MSCLENPSVDIADDGLVCRQCGLRQQTVIAVRSSSNAKRPTARRAYKRPLLTITLSHLPSVKFLHLKIFVRQSFNKSLASVPEPSHCISLIIEVEPDYDGPHLGEQITLEFVTQMMQHFKDQKKLHKKYISESIVATRYFFLPSPKTKTRGTL